MGGKAVVDRMGKREQEGGLRADIIILYLDCSSCYTN